MPVLFHEKLQMVLDSIKDPIIVLDIRNKAVTSNAAARDIEHYLDKCVLKQELCSKYHCAFHEKGDAEVCLVKKSLLMDNYSSGFFKFQHHQNRFTTYLHSSTTPYDGFIVLHMKHAHAPSPQPADILENQGHNTSRYDILTGLPNIFFLTDALHQEIQKARGLGTMLAVLFIDINRFGRINHFFGREQGDAVLQMVSQRIQNTLRASDVLIRQGGDVFIAIIADNEGNQDIGIIVNKILKAIALPITVRGELIRLKATAGISVYPKDGILPNTLIKNADIALQRAKADSVKSFRFYASSMDKGTGELLLFESRLLAAIERNELALHYQPLIATGTGRMVGAEVLIRWNSPHFGCVLPSKFIPIAERMGVILDIGKWVVQTACRQMSEWIRSGFPPITVSVNVSMKQFRDPDLLHIIRDSLDEACLAPECLCLEITENIIMDNPQSVIETMSAISALGVELAIDDFGTGYSSLNYLKKLPVQKLKIDRSFIKNITNDEADAAIVKSVIALAHNFRLKVNAEGVETLEHMDFLRQLGCDELQGYFLSPPLSAEDFAILWTNTLLLHGVHSGCEDIQRIED
ncbi:MAG TPA: EAL domain-containing protein [Dissulfurispiraceae bacterium]|nr:EAL domain-containing protein [Dissulfurispiraceae bacterium]